MKSVFLVLFICVGLMSDAQSKYSKYIVPDSASHNSYVKHKYGDEKIQYLGVIRKSNKDTLYFAFSVFERVQAAMVMHGHSNIIFLDKKRREVKRYDVNLPENLPYKLSANCLYFKYKNETTSKKETYKFKIQAKLPDMVCYSPTECE